MARVLTFIGLFIAVCLFGQVRPFTVADQTWQGTNAVASGGGSFSSIGSTNVIVVGDSMSSNDGGPTNTIIGYFYNTAGLVTNKSSVNGNAGRTDLTSGFSTTNTAWDFQIWSNYIGAANASFDNALAIPGHTLSEHAASHYDTWSPPYDGSTPELYYLDKKAPYVTGNPRLEILMLGWNDNGLNTNNFVANLQTVAAHAKQVGDRIVYVPAPLVASDYTAGNINSHGQGVTNEWRWTTNLLSLFDYVVTPLYTNQIYYGWSTQTTYYMTDNTHPLTSLHALWAGIIFSNIVSQNIPYGITNIFGEWWKFNDGSGNPADSSGWGHPLFLNGSTSWITGIGAGGQSLLFSGGYAAVTNLTVNIQTNTVWTMNCWITNRQVAASSAYRIAGTWNNGVTAGWEWGIGTTSGGVGQLYFLMSTVNGSSYTYYQGTATINNGGIHMLTITCAGNMGYPNMTLYIDGAVDTFSSSSPQNPPGLVNNGTLWIAKDLAGGELQFQGAMADYSVFSQCLTANQVAVLYNNGVRYQ